jgi:hypothetical protein
MFDVFLAQSRKVYKGVKNSEHFLCVLGAKQKNIIARKVVNKQKLGDGLQYH